MAKTWKEKMDGPKDVPKVVKVEGKMAGRWGAKEGDSCVIVSPYDIYDLMSKIPEGMVMNMEEVRKVLSKKYKTNITCPLTSGIFVWIAANYAQELFEKGEMKNPAPWWRILKGKNELHPRFPNYPNQQKTMLESEGHKVVQKGNKWVLKK